MAPPSRKAVKLGRKTSEEKLCRKHVEYNSRCLTMRWLEPPTSVSATGCVLVPLKECTSFNKYEVVWSGICSEFLPLLKTNRYVLVSFVTFPENLTQICPQLCVQRCERKQETRQQRPYICSPVLRTLCHSVNSSSHISSFIAPLMFYS